MRGACSSLRTVLRAALERGEERLDDGVSAESWIEGRCATLKDECLAQVAHTAARYGGEELAAILPDSSLQNAERVAHAFRARVEALAIPHAGSERGIVSVSVGVAGIAGTDTVRELLRHADQALSQAKGAGRGTVRVWQDNRTNRHRRGSS